MLLYVTPLSSTFNLCVCDHSALHVLTPYPKWSLKSAKFLAQSSDFSYSFTSNPILSLSRFFIHIPFVIPLDELALLQIKTRLVQRPLLFPTSATMNIGLYSVVVVVIVTET